jgi:NAD(P)H-quinone oxidoreductase subunit L
MGFDRWVAELSGKIWGVWSKLFAKTMPLPIAPLLYLALAGAYLLALPLLIIFYMKARWYVASSIERVLMYFLVFFFFPGLLIISPFLNFRPQPRQMG